MNAELKTLIQERNRLRRDMGANSDAWVAKTREVLEKTQEAKRNTWRAHLEEVTRTKDAKKVWAVVKSLNGSARALDGKTLVYKGREYVIDKAKASAFIQGYATVSGRKSDRSSRRAVRELRSGVRRLLGSPRQELEQAFTPEELATALKTVKAGKAGGPDLLKHLPLNTQKELLFILNASWTMGWCPQAWRTATIVPFSKKEKDPQAVSRYRPLAPTSTIGKLLERLIVNRHFWWLEAKSLISPWQAGFRKSRCTIDQCLWLSQFVSDGFLSTNKERTVHMLFDYSKTYDTVWRTGLLQKMLDIGVPLRFVQWTTAWLTNRIARVQLYGVTGRCRTFKEGLPQGSVLSPLLFVLYINDLLGNFSESTMVSAYTDDLALACRGRKNASRSRQGSKLEPTSAPDPQCCKMRSSFLQSRQRWGTVATPNYHQRGPTELHPFAEVPGRNVWSSYDLRHPGQKGVPANASANQPPSCRWRYDLGLAKARFENSLHCYTTQRRWVCSCGLDTLALVLQHQEAWKNPTSSCQGDHPSRPLHTNRLSCMKLTFPGSNIGLRRWVFSRLTSGTVSMSRTRGEWSWTTAWGYGFVDQTGTPLFLRPCQAWAYWRTIRGITHHPDLTHLGAIHHQLPRRRPMFPSQCRGTSS